MLNKISITYLFISLSFIFTIFATLNNELYVFWLNKFFLNEWNYLVFSLQLFLSNFLHWWITHLAFNSLFLYLFWTQIELLIWRVKYLYFFIFIVFFNWFFLVFLAWDYVNTIWISGFCMAIISYFVLELKSKNNPEYKWWITALVINVWIWFLPWISLVWHLFWAIWWVIFYYINKEYLRPKWIWKVETQ